MYHMQFRHWSCLSDTNKVYCVLMKNSLNVPHAFTPEMLFWNKRAFSLQLGMFGLMWTQQSHSDVEKETNEPRLPGLGSILFKTRCSSFAVETQLSSKFYKLDFFVSGVQHLQNHRPKGRCGISLPPCKLICDLFCCCCHGDVLQCEARPARLRQWRKDAKTLWGHVLLSALP